MSLVTRRVDAHHHLWDLDRRDQPWIDPAGMAAIRRSFGPADLAAAVAGTGVRRTVLVQVLNTAPETAELLALASEVDLVAGVVGWVDPSGPATADRLAALRASRGGELLVGIRHQVLAEADPVGWLDRSEVADGLRAVARAGLAYDLIIRPEHFAAAHRVIRRHPDLTFVLNHLGKPPIATGPMGPWAEGIRRLAAEPNLVCKLSGMVTMAERSGWTVADLRPYAETALDAFGADRIMFGSDWPVSLQAADYHEVVDTVATLVDSLHPDEQHQIFTGTAERIYRLPHAPSSATASKPS